MDASAKQLHNYFEATNDLIKVISRACGYSDISDFNQNDLSTFNPEMNRLAGINYAGVN